MRFLKIHTPEFLKDIDELRFREGHGNLRDIILDNPLKDRAPVKSDGFIEVVEP